MMQRSDAQSQRLIALLADGLGIRQSAADGERDRSVQLLRRRGDLQQHPNGEQSDQQRDQHISHDAQPTSAWTDAPRRRFFLHFQLDRGVRNVIRFQISFAVAFEAYRRVMEIGVSELSWLPGCDPVLSQNQIQLVIH
jgi:hypothetical protein